ncbi:hypothetical protein TorRG33x02_120670 [Trema orientale]|uniref:Uncharacterized protein n=1 Tax=Trema orientale TaxID=63057 RepID=A0A2P5F396_TREOI|nr:hypothetical protein TorRG33x02_120670 [Trema orientale]
MPILLCINLIAKSALPAFLRALIRTVRTLPGISLPLSTMPSANLQASLMRPALHNILIISSKAVSGIMPIGAKSSKILQALATFPERQSPIERALKDAAVGVIPLSIIMSHSFNASSFLCSLNSPSISIVYV